MYFHEVSLERKRSGLIKSRNLERAAYVIKADGRFWDICLTSGALTQLISADANENVGITGLQNTGAHKIINSGVHNIKLFTLRQ